MASKYLCPQCERKFIDWGAEKLGFKCPDCEDTELKEIGFEPAAKAKKKKPTLKRKKKAAATKKKATATKKKAATTKKKATATKKSKAAAADSETSESEASGIDGFSINSGSDTELES